MTAAARTLRGALGFLLAALAAAAAGCSGGGGGSETVVVRRHLIRPLLERGVAREAPLLAEPVPILHDLAIGLGFLNDVEKMSLTGRPGGWARIEGVALPAAARLEFDVAVQRPGWALHPDGVTVTVEASAPPGSPPRTIVAAKFDPARVEADRAWRRVEADVAALGGGGALVDLTFRIDGATDGAATADASVPTVAIGWPMIAGTAPRGESARPTRATASRKTPNVLVVLVDALRADRLSCYGHERETSPAIDALARESVRYTAAIAPASWTTPSVASLMTGLAPRAHGVVSRERARLPDACETLAESYAEAGYATAAFVTNPIVDRRANFDQGFRTFELLPHFKADAAIGAFLEWLDALPPEPRAPFFAYLHLLDPHAPYSAPPPFGGRFDPGYAGELTPEFWDEMRLSWQMTRERGEEEKRKFAAEKMATFKREREHCSREYDAEVAFMDDAVGRLVARLRADGLLDDTVVVLTADHGEAFFEHGFHGHGKDLHEETVRIPLLVRRPGASGAGTVVGAPVSLVDVGATLAKITSVRPSPRSEGRSILPEDAPPADRVVYSTIETGRTRESATEVAMDAARAVRRKAIEIAGAADPLLLFDLESDPREERPLGAAPLPEGFESLVRGLAAWRERTGRETPDTTVPMDDVQYAILKGLGYVK